MKGFYNVQAESNLRRNTITISGTSYYDRLMLKKIVAMGIGTKIELESTAEETSYHSSKKVSLVFRVPKKGEK